jgi:hypothetical protein
VISEEGGWEARYPAGRRVNLEDEADMVPAATTALASGEGNGGHRCWVRDAVTAAQADGRT